jgi:5-methylcytosine-specific restriction endonuclease McrA
MKRCSKCKVEKDETEFYHHKKTRDRLQSWCKACKAELNRQRWATNSEFRVQQREYQNARYATDPVYCSHRREYEREYIKQRRTNSVAYRRHRNQMVSARQRELVGSYTFEEWLAKLEEFNWHCALCGGDLLQLPARDVTADHIVPVSRGGPNTIDNVQPACRSCNCSKGNR